MDFESITHSFDLPLMELLQGSESLFADRMMFCINSTAVWLPFYSALFFLVLRNNENMKQIALFLGCGLFAYLLTDTFVCDVVNPVFMRLRPSHEPLLRESITLVNNYHGNKHGFFSANAAGTMSVAVFFYLVIRNKMMGIFLLLWSLTCSLSRVYLGVNYPSDILAGYLWGILVSIVTYIAFIRIYHSISTQGRYVSSQYTVTGYSLTGIYTTLSILMLTYIYILIRCIFPI